MGQVGHPGSGYIIGNPDGVFKVCSSEENHIPISRQLGYEMREFFIEISIKDAIVLKDENVGSLILSSCLEHRQMALQATIVARGIRPCIGNLHFQAVCSREPL